MYQTEDEMTKRKNRRENDLPVVHARAAGIDIGSQFHVVAVAPDCDPEPVRTFRTFTGDLHNLADWLVEVGVTTIAMESTSIYWIPAFEILEERGFEVILVNARDAKQVPGRKTDTNDAQWLQKLHAYGLLRASFRPRLQIVALRSYVRQRERLLENAASHVQHMQKALMEMNVQLHHVIADITGATGMRIIRAIVAGERDALELARLRDAHCKQPIETIQAALAGHFQPEHVFALIQAIEFYDFCHAQIAVCDRRIEGALKDLQAHITPPPSPLPAARQRNRGHANDFSFDVRSALYQILGLDPTQIHGIGSYLALKLVAECGTDMSRWPSVKHFTSWLCLAPGNKISGGRVLSSRTRRSSSRAAATLRLAATAVGKTDTALGAFYRRLSARIGKAKAVTATARKIAVLFYNALRYGMAYVDPGATYYEDRYRQRVVNQLRRRAASFGYVLQEGEAVALGVS
jgi:transposase